MINKEPTKKEWYQLFTTICHQMYVVYISCSPFRNVFVIDDNEDASSVIWLVYLRSVYVTYCYLWLLFSLTFGIIFVFILKCQLKDPVVVFFNGNVLWKESRSLNFICYLIVRYYAQHWIYTCMVTFNRSLYFFYLWLSCLFSKAFIPSANYLTVKH
jgi:hypothetical protein